MWLQFGEIVGLAVVVQSGSGVLVGVGDDVGVPVGVVVGVTVLVFCAEEE